MHQAATKSRPPAPVPPESPGEEIQLHASFLWKDEGHPARRDLDLGFRTKELVRRLLLARPPARPAGRHRAAH